MRVANTAHDPELVAEPVAELRENRIGLVRRAVVPSGFAGQCQKARQRNLGPETVELVDFITLVIGADNPVEPLRCRIGNEPDFLAELADIYPLVNRKGEERWADNAEAVIRAEPVWSYRLNASPCR